MANSKIFSRDGHRCCASRSFGGRLYRHADWGMPALRDKPEQELHNLQRYQQRRRQRLRPVYKRKLPRHRCAATPRRSYRACCRTRATRRGSTSPTSRGQGSYAVNFNATYVQSGSNYATVFPCIIYIGSLAGGPLVETASVSGKRLYVNVTNTASQEHRRPTLQRWCLRASRSASHIKTLTVAPNGNAGLSFDIATPAYTDASFPVIGELSYEYNGTHYAQMASAALVFGSAGSAGAPTAGMGAVGWALVAIVVVILVLIAASIS